MNKKQTPTEKPTLNDYYTKRNKEAIKAVAKMKKRPKSYEEMKAVIQRSLSE